MIDVPVLLDSAGQLAVLREWTRAKTISQPMAEGGVTPASGVIMIVTMIGIATGN